MLGDDLRPTWMLRDVWVCHDAELTVMFTFWELGAVGLQSVITSGEIYQMLIIMLTMRQKDILCVYM